MKNEIPRDLGTLIGERQAALGLADSELAAVLGYTNEKVVTLMKSGAMRVPLNKVSALAAALKLDYFAVLQRVLTEAAPEVWEVIAQLAPLGPLRPAEVNLLRHLRQLGGDREIAPVVFDGKAVVALVAVE